MLRFLIRDALQWDKSKFESMKKKNWNYLYSNIFHFLDFFFNLNLFQVLQFEFELFNF